MHQTGLDEEITWEGVGISAEESYRMCQLL